MINAVRTELEETESGKAAAVQAAVADDRGHLLGETHEVHHVANPPEADWNGIRIMKSK